jgi:hypothetical protein
MTAGQAMRELHADYRTRCDVEGPFHWFSSAGIGVGSAFIGAFVALTKRKQNEADA